MKLYTTTADAVADMRERGFDGDFELVGNDLLWVQQKTFIRMGLFTIIECQRFWHPAVHSTDLILLGVIALHHNVRGILLVDYASHPNGCPPVIAKKMNELNQKVLYWENIENENM
ncbi:MAG: hypothetical protein ABIU63_12585 [Chitinophagaceae bacterium]